MISIYKKIIYWKGQRNYGNTIFFKNKINLFNNQIKKS
jgi:hypothetical protein